MPDSKDRILKAYNEWAEIYDTNQNKTRDLNASVLREQNFSLAGKRVLEAGCGTGINSEYFAEHANTFTGIDLSEEMLSKARERVKRANAEFHIRDITGTWGFGIRSFDFISANLVLEHIQNLSHIFRQAFRTLDVSGTFYLSELHPYRQLQQSQARYTSRETGEEVFVDAFPHSVSEFINTGLKAGFRLETVGEHKAEGDDIPRLLTLTFRKM